MMRLLYLLQIAAGPTPAQRVLPTLVPPACAKGAADEIVVCRNATTDRYGPRLAEPEPLLPQAEFRLFGQVRAGMAGEQRGVGGFSAPAAMAHIRIPF